MTTSLLSMKEKQTETAYDGYIFRYCRELKKTLKSDCVVNAFSSPCCVPVAGFSKEVMPDETSAKRKRMRRPSLLKLLETREIGGQKYSNDFEEFFIRSELREYRTLMIYENIGHRFDFLYHENAILDRKAKTVKCTNDALMPIRIVEDRAEAVIDFFCVKCGPPQTNYTVFLTGKRRRYAVEIRDSVERGAKFRDRIELPVEYKYGGFRWNIYGKSWYLVGRRTNLTMLLIFDCHPARPKYWLKIARKSAEMITIESNLIKVADEKCTKFYDIDDFITEKPHYVQYGEMNGKRIINVYQYPDQKFETINVPLHVVYRFEGTPIIIGQEGTSVEAKRVVILNMHNPSLKPILAGSPLEHEMSRTMTEFGINRSHRDTKDHFLNVNTGFFQNRFGIAFPESRGSIIDSFIFYHRLHAIHYRFRKCSNLDNYEIVEIWKVLMFPDIDNRNLRRKELNSTTDHEMRLRRTQFVDITYLGDYVRMGQIATTRHYFVVEVIIDIAHISYDGYYTNDYSYGQIVRFLYFIDRKTGEFVRIHSFYVPGRGWDSITSLWIESDVLIVGETRKVTAFELYEPLQLDEPAKKTRRRAGRNEEEKYSIEVAEDRVDDPDYEP
ncbi:unnamed protein product [Caenorhabditis bovis]|uniref:Uncharacterized protein n=1 Tax=Caenorhabditis bovis TaxID=2654633 RepID=A0A8S1FGA5_9PELO|nr:unnamed protein product [Caenorhabditis bovis]